MKLTMQPTSDLKIFDAYVASHPYGHYMKTSMWAKTKEAEGNKAEYMYFVDEEDRTVGSVMLFKNKWMGHSYYYVPLGPCIDYENKDTVKQVFTLLKIHAQKGKVDFLRVDPNVVRKSHDIKGNDIEGPNHEYVTDELIEMGYVHKGYGYAYDGSWTNRFTLIVDLKDDITDVEKRFDKVRQRSLKRAATHGVKTRVGTKEDVKTLCELEMQLFSIKGSKPNKKEYFEKILDFYQDNAVIYVTNVDLNEMASSIEEEMKQKKYKTDLKALEHQKQELEHTHQLIEEFGDNIDIAAALMLRLGDKSWDLYTYNHKDFGFIRPVDSIHRFAMEDMKSHGVVDYDMVGFSGTVDKSDPNFGLYNYKSSFGPKFIERIGQFDYSINAKATERFNFERKVRNHLRRKWYVIRYQKKQK